MEAPSCARDVAGLYGVVVIEVLTEVGFPNLPHLTLYVSVGVYFVSWLLFVSFKFL